MTDRLDELMTALADGALSAPEAEELEQRLAGAGPEAVRRARTLLLAEAGLRRLQVGGDVNDAVMAAIAARQGAAVDGVMEHVARRAPAIQHGWRARDKALRRARRGRWIGVSVGLLAAAAFAAFLVGRERGADRGADRGANKGQTPPSPSPEAKPETLVPLAPQVERRVTSPPSGPEAYGSPRVLLSYDFEDGAIPLALQSAAVVPGPPRPGNSYVAVGGLSRLEPRSNFLQFDLRRGRQQVSFTHGTVLSFDYWAGVDTPAVVVQLFSPTHARNFHTPLRNLTRERWSHATVRLSDLTANDRSGRVLAPGDSLASIVLVGGRLPGGGLFIDNVRIEEYGEGAVPATGLTALPE